MENISDEALLSELQKRLTTATTKQLEHVELLKQLENVNQRLKESETLKTNFLSNIRNEIINPFTSILALSKSIISVDIADRDKIRTMIALIHSESFDLDFQFKNIFAAAAIEAGEFEPHYSRVNVKEALLHVLELFVPKCSQKHISIKTDTSGLKNLFITDAEKLHLIFSNLISNAIKYSHAGGEVLVVAEEDDTCLRISVQDKGIGFDKKSEQVILNRFTQLDSGLTRSYGGHGLGLSVTSAAVELMQGTLQITGKEHAGCTVIITLNAQPDDAQLNEADSANGIFFNTPEIF